MNNLAVTHWRKAISERAGQAPQAGAGGEDAACWGEMSTPDTLTSMNNRFFC